MAEKIKKRYKIITIGDSDVGKTSIITRLCQKKYNPYDAYPTVGAAFSIHKIYLKYDGLDYEIELNIWDTAGQERYRALVPVYMRDSSAILYVFDLSHPESYNSIEDYWMHRVSECKNPEETVNFLIANKKDISNKSPNVEKFADFVNNNYEYYQTSAQTGENIDKMFRNLAMRLVDKKGLEIEASGKKNKENQPKQICCR